MNNLNFNGFDHINADKDLIDNTVKKVLSGEKSHYYFNVKTSVVAAASLMAIIGAVTFYSFQTKGNANNEIANKTIVDSNISLDKASPSSNIVPIESLPDKNTVNNSVIPDKPAPNTNNGSVKEVPSGNVTPSNVVPAVNLPSSNTSQNNNEATTVVKSAPEIYIPQINLNPTNGTHAKMLALVVYNGKIYTQSATELDTNNIENYIGEKIGRSINNINEWNVKDKSSEELASNIGEQDIYTVKGYDANFRIMSYSVIEGQKYAQFFDCLNGITIKSGNDILGKLNLVNNVESAKFITFDDWNNGVNNYIAFKDMNLLNEALKELNNGIPYKYEYIEKDIDNSRNNDGFKQFTLKLKDGSESKFTAFKNGYVSYGYSNIYFKVDNSAINKLWEQ